MAADEKRESVVSEKKRKVFSGEFKAKLALEAIRGVRSVNEIAQEFGVHPTQVGQWKKELLEQAGSLFEIKRGPKPVDESASPERLYSEIGRLKMELDWLKKSPGSAFRRPPGLDRPGGTLGAESAMRAGRNFPVDSVHTPTRGGAGSGGAGAAGVDRRGIHAASVLREPQDDGLPAGPGPPGQS